MWLDYQYRLCGEAQPRHPPAGGGDWTPGHHALPGRSRLARSVDPVPSLLQLCVASCESALATAPADSDQRDGLGQAMAALYTRDGSRVDGPRVVAERSPPVSGTAVATATDSLKQDAGCDSWCGGAPRAQRQAKGHGRGLGNRFRVMMTG